MRVGKNLVAKSLPANLASRKQNVAPDAIKKYQVELGYRWNYLSALTLHD
jgi:hypothetical protein